LRTGSNAVKILIIGRAGKSFVSHGKILGQRGNSATNEQTWQFSDLLGNISINEPRITPTTARSQTTHRVYFVQNFSAAV
jgi:hypothetical protein